MHRTTPEFWRHFDRLPDQVQRLARRNFDLLKANTMHPSLHFEKVGKFWSARVGRTGRNQEPGPIPTSPRPGAWG